MEVGYLGKLFRRQAAVKRIETFHAMILAFKVSLHEVDVRRQVFKERPGKLTAEHGDAYIRILRSQ